MAREQRDVFDEVAASYDRARAGYPEALFDDVLAFAQLDPGERILEIGAGTGKATLGFARHGHPVLCLEPGERLAALLERNCADHPVEVARVRFEDFAPGPTGFGLVAAAQAFHWVDPEVGLARAVAALRPGGTLALFWNRPQRGDSELHRAVEACYLEHARALPAEALAGYRSRDYAEEIRACGAFGTVVRAAYAFGREYDPDGYVELLGTQSDHRMLDAGARASLLDAIAGEVAAHGGRIRVDYRTELFLARRQPTGRPTPLR